MHPFNVFLPQRDAFHEVSPTPRNSDPSDPFSSQLLHAAQVACPMGFSPFPQIKLASKSVTVVQLLGKVSAVGAKSSVRLMLIRFRLKMGQYSHFFT